MSQADAEKQSILVDALRPKGGYMEGLVTNASASIDTIVSS